MSNSFQLSIKQTQKLVITQELRQSIEMLQLSTVELAEKIANELLENPIIEETSTQSDTFSEEDRRISSVDQNLSGDETVGLGREEPESVMNQYERDNSYADSEGDRKRQYIENAVERQESLKEHLLWQAMLSSTSEKEHLLFQNIITLLDDDGFLQPEPSVIATDNKVNESLVAELIQKISLFDPVGCAARDTQQSLVFQARCFYPDELLLLKVLENYFDYLEKLDYDYIAKALSVSQGDVIAVTRLVHNLNPFPGRVYSTSEITYIVPDIEVKYIDDEIIVSMNEDILPGIGINSYYERLLKQKSLDEKQREYIQEKLQSARYFLKNIMSRKDTIQRVVTAIMNHQVDFLIKGQGNLKPLTHMDIAAEIDMHESTVSRAIRNKYVQTVWGVYPLKYFFVSKIRKNNQSDISESSSDVVKGRIQKMISGESPDHPLSDDDLVKILTKEGFVIARRTVAKYRSVLNIPSAVKRKKINMMKVEGNL